MKAKKIIGTITILLIMLFAVYALLSVVISKFTGNQPRIFGYSLHVVVTDSMTPAIEAGDFILAKKTDKSSVAAGDYIIFVSPDPSLAGMLIVHCVTEVYDEGGEIFFRTSGIKEGISPDEYPVGEIIGVYAGKSAFMGKVVTFFSKLQNLLFIAVIAALSITAAEQVKKIIKLKKSEK